MYGTPQLQFVSSLFKEAKNSEGTLNEKLLFLSLNLIFNLSQILENQKKEISFFA